MTKPTKKKVAIKPIKLIYNCPCCNSEEHKHIQINTDWGYEWFIECLNCGVIFREVTK